MAKLGTSKHDLNQSPTGRAYNWGNRGVEVTTTLLKNWLAAHTENSLLLRSQNLQRRVSGPGATFHHWSTVFLGVGVFLTALYVDYNIIHEFWTRALSNEFGEVPPNLVNTVAAKSLQVVFATLAIHYLITHIGHGGRVAYSLFIFLLTAFMVTGIGLLWADNSLPAGSQIFNTDVNQSAQQLNDFMKGLGMKAQHHAAAVPAEVKFLKKYQVLVWLFSLAAIFLVVASIGAMALHSAMRGFTGITGGALYDNHAEAVRGNRVRDDLRQAQLDLQHLRANAEDFKQAKLAEFITHYTEGVVAGGYGDSRRGYLLRRANESAEEVADSFSFSSSPDNVENLDAHRGRQAA